MDTTQPTTGSTNEYPIQGEQRPQDEADKDDSYRRFPRQPRRPVVIGRPARHPRTATVSVAAIVTIPAITAVMFSYLGLRCSFLGRTSKETSPLFKQRPTGTQTVAIAFMQPRVQFRLPPL